MKDVEVFLNDTIDFLQGTNSGRGTQALIGHGMLFRGFIVKDWFGGNRNQTKYQNVNKIIVKESVMYYGKCWKDRNEIAENPTIRRDRTMIWLNNFVKNNESCEHKILRQYVRNMPKNIKNMSTENIQSWLINAHMIKKNAPTIKVNDIRNYLVPSKSDTMISL